MGQEGSRFVPTECNVLGIFAVRGNSRLGYPVIVQMLWILILFCKTVHL